MEREERRKDWFPVRVVLGHIVKNYMTVILLLRRWGAIEDLLQKAEVIPLCVRIFKPTQQSAFSMF